MIVDRKLRCALADAIEAMIVVLDAIDGDPDMEIDEPDREHDGSEIDDGQDDDACMFARFA
jgi:hypothetical protein